MKHLCSEMVTVCLVVIVCSLVVPVDAGVEDVALSRDNAPAVTEGLPMTPQPAPATPKVGPAGSSPPGGDIGEVIEHDQTPFPIWQRLEALSPTDRANAEIRLEPGSETSVADLNAMRSVEYLWNRGLFDDGVWAIRSLEESRPAFSVGIGWRTPRGAGLGDHLRFRKRRLKSPVVDVGDMLRSSGETPQPCHSLPRPKENQRSPR